jgi:hypothetical protein
MTHPITDPTDLAHDAASYHDQVLDSLGASLSEVAMAVEIVTNMPEAERFCSVDELRCLSDAIERLTDRAR